MDSFKCNLCSVWQACMVCTTNIRDFLLYVLLLLSSFSVQEEETLRLCFYLCCQRHEHEGIHEQKVARVTVVNCQQSTVPSYFLKVARSLLAASFISNIGSRTCRTHTSKEVQYRCRRNILHDE